MGAFSDIALDPGAAGNHADRLLRPDGPVPPSLARDALIDPLAELTAIKQARIGNAHGWAAARAAGDLARLDTGPQVAAAAG